MKASLRASDSTLSDAQQCVQELELTRNTVNQLATKVGEAERAVDASLEHVQYLED